MSASYSGSTTSMPPSKMNFYTNIMPYKVAFVQRVALLAYIQLQVRVVTKICSLFQMIPKHFRKPMTACARSVRFIKLWE